MVLFRFHALYIIPFTALLLKEYFGWAYISSTCHKEHAPARLGDSEKFSIEGSPRNLPPVAKHSTCVRPFFPCRLEWYIFAGKCAKEAAKGVVFGVEHAWHVFPNKDAGLLSLPGSNKVNCIEDSH